MTTISLNQSLLGRGYFPAEMPPPFTTESLGGCFGSIVLPKNPKPNCSKCVPFSIPRTRTTRRRLSIPNPLHQIQLTLKIGEHWGAIQKHIATSKLSRSKPRESDTTAPRAVVPEIQLHELSLQKLLHSESATCLLQADFSRYYATIYTHSLPWALHTKAHAKRNRGSSLFGNDLDFFVRNTQDQQTLGIPVGPDTSLILAEIIGASIDAELGKTHKLNGFRYIDDYFLFFAKQSDATNALNSLQRIAASFELELTPSKTRIHNWPSSFEPPWVYELRVFELHSKGSTRTIKDADLISYFSKALALAHTHREDNVLKYALGKLRNLSPDLSVNWPLYESIILNCIQAEPSTLPLACELFARASSSGAKISVQRIRKALFPFLVAHARLFHTYEVIWALWLLKLLDIRLSDLVTKTLAQVDDPLIALACLDLREQGLFSTPDLSLWRSKISGDYLYNEFWILSYEASRQGWFTRKSHLKDDPFFSQLLAKDVSFYDSSSGEDLEDAEEMVETQKIRLIGYN